MENKNNYQRTFWSKTGKILNYSWKVAIVVIGILAAIFIAAGVREYNHRHYSQVAHEWDRHLSENICVHSIHGYWVKVYDLEAKKYVTRKLKWVSGIPDRDSLTVFCDKNDIRSDLPLSYTDFVTIPRIDVAAANGHPLLHIISRMYF